MKDIPKLVHNCRPLSIATWVWFGSWPMVFAILVFTHNGLAASLAFLVCHWVACWYLSKAAQQLGKNPWFFGFVPALLPPIYLLLSSKLRWRAWEVLADGT